MKNVKVDENVSTVVVSVDCECERYTDMHVVWLEADPNKSNNANKGGGI